MPFSINCTNKGCCKLQEPYIDPKADKVYCSFCDKEINNITYFTKVQMKSLKQFKQKSTISFSVKCEHCNKEGRPKISTSNEVVCGFCSKVLENLSIPFRNMLKDKLKDVNKDV